MKFFFTGLLCYYCILAKSSDTILSSLIINEFPIFNIVSDSQGRIFFSDKNGVKTIENFQIKKFDTSYKGELLVEGGKLVYAENQPDKGWEKRKKYRESQPQEWVKFLQGEESNSFYTVASLNKNLTFVAAGSKIYVFKIEDRFNRFLKGHSTRKIGKYGDLLLVSTYSGLSKNEMIIDSSNLGGPFLENNGQWLGGSKNTLWYYSNLLEGIGKLDSLDLTPSFKGKDVDIIALEKFNEYYWIGTNRGLLVVRQDGNLQLKLPDQIIESFVLDGENMYITSSKGIFKVGPDLVIENTDIYNNCVNHFFILPGKWLLATNFGLYEYEIQKRKINKIKLIGENMVINSIVKDANDFIWLSTEKGIFRINPKDNSFWHYCQDVEFNKRSFFISGDTIFFGSIKGVFAFNSLNPKFNTKHISEFYPVTQSKKNWIWIGGAFLLSILIFSWRFFIHKSLDNKKTSKENLKELNPVDLKKRCEQSIQKNLSSITVDSLAEDLGMTKRMLFRKLEPAGLKPGEIIRNVRKEFLIKLLKEQPNVSITDLSSITGYSENHLIKVLREIKTDKK